VLLGSAGVVLVVVVDLVASWPGAELVVVVVDLVTSGLGVVLVAVVVVLLSSAAAHRVSSIIVATSMATNIFFISKPLFSFEFASPKLQAAIPPGGMNLQIQAIIPPR
jgi:hypothetical protein